MERNFSLDILKLCLAFMVVGLHSGFLNEISTVGNVLTVQGLFRIAVPLFLIINGYYFSSITNLTALITWVTRVGALYAFWMIFYSYFWFRPDSFSVIETVKLIHTILVGYHHLWYLSGMIGAGILMFLLRNNMRNASCIAALCFFVGVVIQYIGNYHIVEHEFVDKLFNMTFIHRNFLFLAFPFFFIGFYLKQNSLRISTSYLYTIAIFGTLFLLIESFYNYSNPMNDGGFDNFISLVIICPALFLIALNSKKKNTTKTFALLSTGVYFIHPIWLIILRKFTFLGDYGTLLTFVCLVLSVISGLVLIKIKDRTKLSFLL